MTETNISIARVPQVTVIDPRIPEKAKLRVAAYARVSSDSEDQVNSYIAQVDFYTKHIAGKEDWEMVDIYVDSALYLSQMDEIDRKLRELRKLRRRLLEAAGEDRQIHDTERMMEYLEDGPEWLDEVPAELFGELIERIIIISPERLKFRLLNGMELAENIERTVR